MFVFVDLSPICSISFRACFDVANSTGPLISAAVRKQRRDVAYRINFKSVEIRLKPIF